MVSRKKNGDSSDHVSVPVNEYNALMTLRRESAIKNGHVSITRDEYDALMMLRDESEVKNATVANRNHDLSITCAAQARRLVEAEQVMAHGERVAGLQRVFIDALRADRPAVAAIEDLSEFWRQWVAVTGKLVERSPQQRDEVSKVEPDLFRSWRLWVNNNGKVDRSLSVAGTRAEVVARQEISQGDLQERIISSLRDQKEKLAIRVHQLEAELDAHKERLDKAVRMDRGL